MGEHRGQLVARGRHAHEAQVHADEAARQREGIDAAVAHEEGLPGEALVQVGADLAALACRGHERLEDALQVLEQDGVVAVVRVAPDLAHDLVAQLALGTDAEVLAGGVAQGGQLVLGGEDGGHERRGEGHRT